MVSDTDLPQQQPADVDKLLDISAADNADQNPTPVARLVDKRYNRKIRPRRTNLAPIILSAPVTETNTGAAAETETHISNLVESLKSTSLETVREATYELRLLAKDMDNRILIAGCGTIGPLVGLLHSPDLQIQEHAVTALLNLSINDNNKVAIAKAEAIEPLIHVLKTGTPEAKENSAAALYSLSVFEENKIRIGNSGAIGPLVELLGSGTPRGKKDAATALFNLSICTENRTTIVESGAVEHLIGLMDPASGMVDRAVVVLANLATVPEGRAAIVEGVGIPLLVEAVELGSARVRENAAAALVHLCKNSNKYCRMVIEEGAVPPLVALSQSGSSGSPRAREKATALLNLLRNLQRNYARRG